VTIVFWSLLAGGGTLATTRSRWSNISKHALNSAFALFEILFSAVGNQPWSHLIFITIFLGTHPYSAAPSLKTRADIRMLFGSGVYHPRDSRNLCIQFPESFQGCRSCRLHLWHFCRLYGHLRDRLDDQVGVETHNSCKDKRWMERAI
jgi:hypothetical protein